MTDTTHHYPKSCCNYLYCDKDNSIELSKNAINNEYISYYYDKNVFKVNQEPSSKVGYTIINPSVLSDDKLDKTFKSYNQKTCYLTRDPRLYNQGGTWIQLDKEPLNSSVKLSSLNTDKSLNNYGKGYNSYSDINTGQYLYYVNKEAEEAFSDPLFSTKAISVGTMYRDPMGSIKHSYERIPIKNYNPIIDNNQYDETDEYCLSFIRDTQFQREDILALQMIKRNMQRYELAVNN